MPQCGSAGRGSGDGRVRSDWLPVMTGRSPHAPPTLIPGSPAPEHNGDERTRENSGRGPVPPARRKSLVPTSPESSFCDLVSQTAQPTRNTPVIGFRITAVFGYLITAVIRVPRVPGPGCECESSLSPLRWGLVPVSTAPGVHAVRRRGAVEPGLRSRAGGSCGFQRWHGRAHGPLHDHRAGPPRPLILAGRAETRPRRVDSPLDPPRRRALAVGVEVSDEADL